MCVGHRAVRARDTRCYGGLYQVVFYRAYELRLREQYWDMYDVCMELLFLILVLFPTPLRPYYFPYHPTTTRRCLYWHSVCSMAVYSPTADASTGMLLRCYVWSYALTNEGAWSYQVAFRINAAVVFGSLNLDPTVNSAICYAHGVRYPVLSCPPCTRQRCATRADGLGGTAVCTRRKKVF